nr:hypothetical protein [Methylobacterium currus]
MAMSWTACTSSRGPVLQHARAVHHRIAAGDQRLPRGGLAQGRDVAVDPGRLEKAAPRRPGVAPEGDHGVTGIEQAEEHGGADQAVAAEYQDRHRATASG